MEKKGHIGTPVSSCILILLLLNAFPAWTIIPTPMINHDVVRYPVDISTLSYVQHDPINITHSDNITSLELPGSGTHSDPYLIEGYQILNPSGGYCISVSMPNEIYVTIRLCRLSGAQGAAIFFDGRYCGIVSCEISSS
ncbi:MAG: hypothetical protein ACW98J_02575, partial [Candidatus Thorarchaeota archaeon]